MGNLPYHVFWFLPSKGCQPCVFRLRSFAEVRNSLDVLDCAFPRTCCVIPGKDHLAKATELDGDDLEAMVHLGKCQHRLGLFHDVRALGLRDAFFSSTRGRVKLVLEWPSGGVTRSVSAVRF